MASGPQHRQPVHPETFSSLNKYILAIGEARARFDAAVETYAEQEELYNTWLNQPLEREDVESESKDTENKPERPDPRLKPTGPIEHGMRTINNFISSASDWTADHLAHFQVIVLNSQHANHLFAAAFLLHNDDPTMAALQNDGFSTTRKRTILQGQWDTTRQYNPVFLSLMLLYRSGERTPRPQTSPQPRNILPRVSRDVALTTISELEESRRLSSETTTDSTVSTISSDPMSVIQDLGPRETLSSFTLAHNLLTYLGTLEHQTRANGPQWINGYTHIQRLSLKRSGLIQTDSR